MDENGDFYASKFPQVGHFHDSHLAGGEPVAAAGEMKVEQGVLILISNKSGHYPPGRTFMEQALDSLSRKGIGSGGVKRGSCDAEREIARCLTNGRRASFGL